MWETDLARLIASMHGDPIPSIEVLNMCEIRESSQGVVVLCNAVGTAMSSIVKCCSDWKSSWWQFKACLMPESPESESDLFIACVCVFA